MELCLLSSRPLRDQLDQKTITGQPARLLRYLALNTDRAVPIEVLIDVLSGTARTGTELETNNIHGYVKEVRTALGKDSGKLLSTRSPSSYRLALEADDRLDLIEFLAYTKTAQAASAAQNYQSAVEEYVKALDLWEQNPIGDLDLSQVINAFWLRDREYFERLVRDTRCGFAEAVLASEQIDRCEILAREIRVWHRYDPTFAIEERSWRLLVRAHMLMGMNELAAAAVADYAAIGGANAAARLGELVGISSSAHASAGLAAALAVVPPIDQEGAVEIMLCGMREDMLARSVAGSRRIKLGHFDAHPELWVPPPGTDTETGGRKTDVLDVLYGSLRSASLADASAHHASHQAGWMILGSAGLGKSTLSTVLVARLISDRIRAKSGPLPILLDLKNYRYEAVNDFCGENWLKHQLSSSMATGASDWPDEVVEYVDRLGHLVVVDSLDEFLIGRPLDDIRRLLQAPVLRTAAILMSRSQFFDQYLQSSDLVSNRTVLELGPWPPAARDLYIHSYYAIYHGADGSYQAAKLIDRIRSSHDMASICSVPVRLNMALDLMEPNDERLPEDIRLLELYETYLTRLLSIESARAGSVLSAREKIHALEDLAWSFYDEGSMGEADAPDFSEVELIESIRVLFPDRSPDDRDAILDDLKFRTILEVNSKRTRLSRDLLHFSHKSYQEYLVATRVYHSLLQNPEGVAAVMKNYLSPEVSEFLKEYLAAVNESARLRTRISSNGLQALRALLSERRNSEDVADRLRIALEQVYYYLGSLTSIEVQRTLQEQLKVEPDPWLRRSITIGLAFSGTLGPLNAYIADLREERERLGMNAPLNSVNIGTKLSYFGDQQFSAASPDSDLGQESCARTVATLIYQLATETERGCWRIDLYALVDLWRWRPQSRASFMNALLERHESVRAVIDRLKSDPYCDGWPELQELEGILQECVSGD